MSNASQKESDPPLAEPAPASFPAGGCEIQLQNPGRHAEVAARRLRPWLEALVAELAPWVGTFVVRFTSDREIRRLNRDFRGRDGVTDVLSFPGGEAVVLPAEDTSSGVHLGDVVVSVPAACRQAREHGHGVECEIRRLVLHGVLHCLGYDHEEDDGTMERLEASLRSRWIATDA